MDPNFPDFKTSFAEE